MAHPDAATTNGYTPLHISAREGQVDVASVLLEAGAANSLATKVRGQPRGAKVSFSCGRVSGKENLCQASDLFLSLNVLDYNLNDDERRL